ncbi:MAG: alpha/beta hydrolase [Myxococcaceae bacterium]|jgi:pimeloyl-ACP methyl ester carboxylesterase|nr:alpha/beta hydrolase [Myxococcaceae bacterium]MCA3016524.1 alpha/beta hydrolase [Myxococcaceae bacterium]
MPDAGARSFHQGFFTTDDGAPLWFEERGEGSGLPAVLCDGLGCDGFIWRYLFGPLAARRRVLHWNYRGHGKSGLSTDPARIGVEYICDDLARLMDHRGLERAVLFGHSMGVQVALEFHRRHAARVAGLVLICGSYGTPLDTWHDHSLMRVVFPRLKALVERFPAQAQWLTSRVLRTELAVELGIRAELNPLLIDHHDFHPYMEHLAKMHPLSFVRTLDSLKDHSALDHLPFVNVPALVVGGEIDKFTPVWLSERMAEHLPDARYLFVQGGSHTAPLERAGLVNATIATFLAERLEPARRVGA